MQKLFLLPIVVVAAACSSEQVTGVNCPDVLRAGIEVTPLDRSSNTIRVKGTLVVTDRSFTDTAINAPPVDPRFYAAYGRAGTYDVQLEIPGYSPWSLSGVVVRTNVCGVTTVPLAATLVAASP